MALLIEREFALETLQKAATRAVNSHGSIILIDGEAGIGKTSLLTEFTRLGPANFPIHWGGCEALFTPRPLGPLQDMARMISPEVADLLDITATQDRIFPALLQALQKAAQARALIFEDVHWADTATLDLIKYLGRRLALLPVVLVLSLRNDEIGTDHPLTQVLGDLPSSITTRITLQPLTLQGVARLAEKAGRASRDLYRITEGNPFFVTELLAYGHAANQGIPASIRDAVWSRLSRLSETERELMEIMSVVPGSVEPQLLHTLMGPQVKASIDRCINRGVILTDQLGGLKFRHELARQATLERLPHATQKSLHARIETAISDAAMSGNTASQSMPLSRRVHHAAGAEDGPSVLLLAPRAAREAARLGAHLQAAAHLSTALKYVSQAPRELAAQLHEDWAYEAGLSQGIDDAIIVARHTAITIWRELGRIDKVGLNLRWLSRLHWYRGESKLANEYVDRAVHELEALPEGPELAMCYSARSQMHMLHDRTDEAIAWGTRAIVLAQQLNEVETRIHALNNVGSALMFSGREGGPQLMEESLELAHQYGFHEQAARAYTNYAEYGVVSKNFALAERILAEGIAFDTRHDLDAWTHYLVGRQAQLRMEQGKLREAETIAQGVMQLDRLTLVMKLPALTVLGKTRVRLGASDGPALLQQALHDALATNEPQYIMPVRLGLIEAAWLNDDQPAAYDQLKAVAQMRLASFDSWESGELAVWWQRCNMPGTLPVAMATMAKPRAAEMRREFSEAADEWLSLGLPYEAALTLAQARGATMGTLLSRAIIIFESMEARPAANHVRELARKAGLIKEMPKKRRGPYAATRKHPLGLTSREVQILKLIVEGLGNQDIAGRIVRSQRTVEHHVSSLLAKLNANSRIDVMLRLRSEPWLLSNIETASDSIN